MLTRSRRHRAVRNFSLQVQLSYKLNQPGRSGNLDVPTQMNLEETFDKFQKTMQESFGLQICQSV